MTPSPSSIMMNRSKYSVALIIVVSFMFRPHSIRNCRANGNAMKYPNNPPATNSRVEKMMNGSAYRRSCL